VEHPAAVEMAPGMEVVLAVAEASQTFKFPAFQ
jgi:hypothetical protein